MPHPIRDARSPKLVINVTQNVIDQSIPKDSGHCMVADAIAARLPRARFISVDLATIRFSDPLAGRRFVYLTPRSVQQALLDFDQGDKPAPFRFTIEHAHVLPTGTGSKGKAELVAKSRSGSKSPGPIPVRVGGESPPLGPLQGGAKGGRGMAGNNRGRRREFGLRAFIR
jgi:hypothetical protein